MLFPYRGRVRRRIQPIRRESATAESCLPESVAAAARRRPWRSRAGSLFKKDGTAKSLRTPSFHPSYVACGFQPQAVPEPSWLLLPLRRDGMEWNPPEIHAVKRLGETRRRSGSKVGTAMVGVFHFLLFTAHSPLPPEAGISASSTARNSSSAASRLTTISAASSAGGGRFSLSSRDSSFSQKMSRLALSRAMISS